MPIRAGIGALDSTGPMGEIGNVPARVWREEVTLFTRAGKGADWLVMAERSASSQRLVEEEMMA